MAERRLIVDKEFIVYEGLFSLTDLYKLINDWLGSKRYFPVEKKCEECVSKTGRCVICKLEPFKKLTDYAKSVIKIKIKVDDCTEKVVTRDGKKQKMQQGKLKIKFSAFLETDYEHRWERFPWMYVFRTLFEKYLFTPYMSGFSRQIREDVDHLKSEISGFLNLYKV